MKKSKLIGIIILTSLVTTAVIFTSAMPILTKAANSDLVNRLMGKILLRVEHKGEAWYVNPDDGQRYSLGRPQDALNLMRAIGLGIADSDLFQIPSDPNNYDIISDPGAYNNTEADFSLNHLSNINLNENLTLTISTTKIEQLNLPSGFDKETALQDRESLNNGEYGNHIDSALYQSEEVVKLKNTYGKSYTVFSRFEICNVTFERRLIFYKNDYQIVITLKGAVDDIKASMPEYFDYDENNCSDYLIWNYNENQEIQNMFYQTLLNNNGSDVAQKWFDTFDEIVDSIEI